MGAASIAETDETSPITPARSARIMGNAAPTSRTAPITSTFRPVGQADSSVTLRVPVPVRIKARFAGNGRSLAKKRNAESRRHRGSRRAAADQNVDLSEARLGFLQ